MSIFKKILKFLGLTKNGWADNAIDGLWIETKAKYPELIQNIKDGIAAIENEDMPGGEKAVRVAMEVMESAPHVLKALPDAKAFFVHGVTQVFAAGLVELRDEAEKLLGKL